MTTADLVAAITEHFLDAGSGATCRDLAKRLGLAESTVQRRIQHLLSPQAFREPSGQGPTVSEGGYFDASVRIEAGHLRDDEEAFGDRLDYVFLYPSSRRLRDVVLAERAKAVRS